jgi:hypothetical protein
MSTRSREELKQPDNINKLRLITPVTKFQFLGKEPLRVEVKQTKSRLAISKF